MSENKTSLIVNYLPQSLTDDEFRGLFTSIGTVKSSKIIRERATNYSYGFGFVEYLNDADYDRAIQTLNGLQLQNKKIKVAYSRKGENVKGANLYVRSLPKSLSEEDFKILFEPYGMIVQARLLYDSSTNQSRGVGFVLYETRDQAMRAINGLDGKIPTGFGEPINVKFAEENRNKPQQQQLQQQLQQQQQQQQQQLQQQPVMVVNTRMGVGASTTSPYGRGIHGVGANATTSYYGNGHASTGPMRVPNQNRVNRYNPMHQVSYPTSLVPVPSAGSSTSSLDSGHILFVYNIGPDADEHTLWSLFSPFGEILRVNVIRDFQKQQGKGYGFVTMANYEEAATALQALNGYCFTGGKPLQVSFKK